MGNRKFIGFVAGVIGLTAGAASGRTVLVTPPARAGFTDEILWCNVTNMSTKDVAVKIELLSYGGAVISSNEYVVNAGTTTSSAGLGGDAAYCRVTAVAPRKSIAAAATYYKNFVATASVPAF